MENILKSVSSRFGFNMVVIMVYLSVHDDSLWFHCGSNCFMFLSRIFVLFEPYVRFHIFS